MPEQPFDYRRVDFRACLDELRLLVQRSYDRGIPTPPNVIQLGRYLRWLVEEQAERQRVSPQQRPHQSTQGVCPACGQNTLDHRHSLTKPLGEALLRVYYAGGGPLRISRLISGRSKLDNFQKLRYWGLAEQVAAPDGTRTDGYWQTTERGNLFCRRELKVPRRVWTYQGEFLEYDQEDDLVDIGELQPGFLNRDDYAAVMQPHGE